MPQLKNEMINFDAEVDRTEVQTLKFDDEMLESIFGEKDLWPSWVADMDFKSSRHIQDALARRVEHGIYGYESNNEALPKAIDTVGSLTQVTLYSALAPWHRSQY